jgi:hypothetical protein
MTKITANIMNGPKNIVRTVACDVNMPMGDTDQKMIQSAVTLWGDKIVAALIVDAATIAAQSTMRTLGKPERKTGRLSDVAIAEKMSAWKPQGRTVDPTKKIDTLKKGIDGLTVEQRAELLKALGMTAPVLVKQPKK